MNAARQLFQGTIADVTQQQADYLPPGVVHPIDELIAHVVQSEDGIVNGMLRGQPTVWEHDGWGARLGVPNVMRHDRAMARGFRCDLRALEPYREAVYASIDEYFKGLKAGDLDRKVSMGGGEMTVAEVLGMLLVGNTLMHSGEISALKGVQGARGYPF